MALLIDFSEMLFDFGGIRGTLRRCGYSGLIGENVLLF